MKRKTWFGFWALALIGQSPSSAETVTYSYDALGRLVRVNSSQTSGEIVSTYAFDAAGNRTSVTVTGATGGGGQPPSGSCQIALSDASPYAGSSNGQSSVVTRSGQCTGTISVRVVSSDGTAIAGRDYYLIDVQLNFAVNGSQNVMTRGKVGSAGRNYLLIGAIVSGAATVTRNAIVYIEQD